MKPLTHVRAALYGQPWMIQEEWLRAICEILEHHAAGDKIAWQGEPGESKVAYQVTDGVGIVDLMGPIFPRANMMTKLSGATSAEEFRSNFSRAVADDDVESILLRVDSPGGAVSGIFEAASLVYASRAEKDIVAMCEGTMASAAYLVGSQAHAVYATEASVVGSIGVVMQIEDDTRQKLNDGVDTHTLKTGPLKAVGAGPVTGDQIQHMRAIMDDYFQKFKGAVQRSRPLINIESVSTGAVWIGKKAEDAGLIDGITTMEDMIQSLSVGGAVRSLVDK